MAISSQHHKAYWAEFVKSLSPNDVRRDMRPDAFAFAGGGELGNELLALVLRRIKQATTSLPMEYTSTNDPLPKAGDLRIVLDSNDNPAAIIETISVVAVPFREVDAAFAAYEGEGDGGLGYWREAHTWYFKKVCQQLGGKFEPTTEVLCQKFKLVWPPGQAVRQY